MLLGTPIPILFDADPISSLLQLNDTAADLVSSTFNYRTDTDVNYEPFTSWPDKYGPETFGPGPDNYTNIVRWNMSDVLTPLNSGGIDISGYLNRSNITTQPFKAENIVVVTDGYCASTCTIFSELMRQQGKPLNSLLSPTLILIAHYRSRRQIHQPRRPPQQSPNPSHRRRKRHQRLPLLLHPQPRQRPLRIPIHSLEIFLRKLPARGLQRPRPRTYSQLCCQQPRRIPRERSIKRPAAVPV